MRKEHTVADSALTERTLENGVFCLQTDKCNVTPFIHYWINYHLAIVCWM